MREETGARRFERFERFERQADVAIVDICLGVGGLVWQLVDGG
jgi:hypothetical protein